MTQVFAMRIVVRLVVACMVVLLFPAHTVHADAVFAVVNNPNPDDCLFLRPEKSADGEPLGLYYNGTPVNLHGNIDDEWVSVRIEPLEGYMKGEYLRLSSDIYDDAIRTPLCTVQAADGFLPLLSRPDASASILETFPNDTLVVLLGEGPEWFHVEVNGLWGFMRADSLRRAGAFAPPVPEVTAIEVGTNASVSIGHGLPAYTFDVRNLGQQYLPGEYDTQWIGVVEIKEPDNSTPLQSLYFSTYINEDSLSYICTLDDMNFDGYLDVLITVSSGTAGAPCSVFLYNPEMKQFEMNEMGFAFFCNYTLYPDLGIIVDYIRDGMAAGDEELYRWRNGELERIRSVRWGEAWDEDSQSFDSRTFQMRFIDSSENPESPKITYHTEPIDIYEEHAVQRKRRIAMRERLLWEGLR